MGYLLHRTDEILVFATANSNNSKTGFSTQVWILNAKNHPNEARKSGEDANTNCRGCKLASYNGCYVTNFPLGMIWKAYVEGRTPLIKPGSSEWSRLFVNQFVRLGAYGNPSMIPLPLLERIIRDARKYTGYFHDWHLLKPSVARDYGKYLMASCDETNWKQAQALGLRSYTISSGPIKGSIQCLNVTKHITCAECGVCAGSNKGTKNVWISSHGFQINKARKATMAAA